MRIVPDIEAMRRDRGLQRRAQAAMHAAGERWRESAGVAPLLADLTRFGEGEPLSTCRALARLFIESDAASEFAVGLARSLSAELAARPFGQVPFRHGFDGQVSTLLLARSGAAQLVLVGREPGTWSHSSAGFSDAERHERVLAGSGEGVLVRRDSHTGALTEQRVPLEPGKLSTGASEVFLRLAVGLGGQEAIDLAERFSRHHPSERMRLTALDAQSGVLGSADADALWRRAECSGSGLVAKEARRRRSLLDAA